MKKIFMIFLFVGLSFSYELKNFQSDIYTKENKLKKIELSMDIVLRDEDINKNALLDALNIIIGSFYAEDLMTSMGKEKFKKTFKKYTYKKYGIDIDEIYILELKFKNEVNLDELIELLKSGSFCKDPRLMYPNRNFNQKPNQEDTMKDKNNFDINQNLGDYGKNFGKDF